MWLEDLRFIDFNYMIKLEIGLETDIREITDASFTILETINHVLERGSKVFGCFLDGKKSLVTKLLTNVMSTRTLG